MYKLTPRRLEKAKDILEHYRETLFLRFTYNTDQFEKALRECWNLGYRELKDIATDMLKHERYKHIAVYYMEHSNLPVVVSEFKPVLAKVYGIQCYHAPDLKQKREAFWYHFRTEIAPKQ